MSFTKSNRLKMAAFLVALSPTMDAFAQQTSDSVGIVRISDARSGASSGEASAQGVNQAGARQIGEPYFDGTANQNVIVDGGNVQIGSCPGGSCPTGGCPTGSCRSGACFGGGYPCGNGCRTGHGCLGCLSGHCSEHYCKRSPDYGYSPPAKYPLLRRGAEYSAYYPAQWYGGGADYSQANAPMVYQPTDTSQLGFYYQHVPSWQPSPNPLPERPIPAQWNVTPPPVSASRYCNGYFAGNLGPYRGCHPNGYGYGHGYGHGWGHGNSWGSGNVWSRGDGRVLRRAYARGAYDVTGWHEADPCSNPQATPTPDANSGQAVPNYQTPLMLNDGSPVPVESGSPSTLPQGSGSYDEGGQPGMLQPGSIPATAPPVPSGRPILPNAPLPPTDSASSGHIKRI